MNQSINQSQGCLQNSPGYTGSVNKINLIQKGTREIEYFSCLPQCSYSHVFICDPQLYTNNGSLAVTRPQWRQGQIGLAVRLGQSRVEESNWRHSSRYHCWRSGQSPSGLSDPQTMDRGKRSQEGHWAPGRAQLGHLSSGGCGSKDQNSRRNHSIFSQRKVTRAAVSAQLRHLSGGGYCGAEEQNRSSGMCSFKEVTSQGQLQPFGVFQNSYKTFYLKSIYNFDNFFNRCSLVIHRQLHNIAKLAKRCPSVVKVSKCSYKKTFKIFLLLINGDLS